MAVIYICPFLPEEGPVHIPSALECVPLPTSSSPQESRQSDTRTDDIVPLMLFSPKEHNKEKKAPEFRHRIRHFRHIFLFLYIFFRFLVSFIDCKEGRTGAGHAGIYSTTVIKRALDRFQFREFGKNCLFKVIDEGSIPLFDRC